jgi:hypothetical protein
MNTQTIIRKFKSKQKLVLAGIFLVATAIAFIKRK